MHSKFKEYLSKKEGTIKRLGPKIYLQSELLRGHVDVSFRSMQVNKTKSNKQINLLFRLKSVELCRWKLEIKLCCIGITYPNYSGRNFIYIIVISFTNISVYKLIQF